MASIALAAAAKRWVFYRLIGRCDGRRGSSGGVSAAAAFCAAGFFTGLPFAWFLQVVREVASGSDFAMKLGNLVIHPLSRDGGLWPW